MGPSITQRLDSYLVRMKFSIFLGRVSKEARERDMNNARFRGHMAGR